MKIRWRLALYAATVTLVSVLGFATLLVMIGSSTSVSNHEQGLVTAVTTAVEDYAALDLARLKVSVTPFIVDSPNSLDAFFVAVGIEGDVQFSTGLVNQSEPTVPAALVLETLAQGQSIVVAPVHGVEMRMVGAPWPKSWPGEGVLVAIQPTEFAIDQIAGLRTVLSIAGVISVISTTIVGWLVSGRAVRPLTNLAETTDNIAATGDLSQRLPPVRARDEVGRLTASFNGMIASLETAREQLGESLNAQRRFVGDASHELRSPLTTIRNNAGFLMDRPDAKPADRTEAIEDISEEADRMTILVDDLLLLARGDEGSQIVRLPAELGGIAASVVRRADKAGVIVALEVSGEVVVMGDEPKLDRLLWILIDNAAKHGRPPLSLKVEASSKAAIVTMEDSGEGFPVVEPNQVFARFFQVDTSRALGGAGLGLSIAEWITHAHGGVVTASNRESGGGLVRVTIPLG